MQSVLIVAGLAFGLAMDAFAVAIAVGVALGRPTSRQFFRLAFHFGLFQFMMPVIGWFAAEGASSVLASIDHWVALGLLSFIGGKMILEALRGDHEQVKGDPTRGASLVMLSVATSIDAFAVGLSLKAAGVTLWFPCIAIGVCAASMTFLGMKLGRRGASRLGQRAEIAGGIVLVLIGIRIAMDHLT